MTLQVPQRVFQGPVGVAYQSSVAVLRSRTPGLSDCTVRQNSWELYSRSPKITTCLQVRPRTDSVNVGRKRVSKLECLQRSPFLHIYDSCHPPLQSQMLSGQSCAESLYRS